MSSRWRNRGRRATPPAGRRPPARRSAAADSWRTDTVQTATTASHTWCGVIGVRSVTGLSGSSGSTKPVSSRNRPGVDDLGHLDAAGEPVQLCARGQQQHRRDSGPHRNPRRFRERHRPQQEGEHIADRHHEADVGKPLGVGLVQAAPVIAGEPGAQCQQPGAQRHQMPRIEPIQQGSRQRQQRKGPYPAGALLIEAGVEFLIGEAEEEPEAQQQQQADNWRRGGHRAGRSCTFGASWAILVETGTRRRRTWTTCSRSCRRRARCGG